VAVDRDVNPLPSRIGDYCSDPHADPRIYGAGAVLPLRDACADSFGERCGEHQSYGLEQVVQQRYLGAHQVGSSVQLRLFGFSDIGGALASFAASTMGDGEPSGSGFVPFTAGDTAALRGETVFVVQGRYVIEARYGNPQQTAQQRESAAQRTLPSFVTALCSKLPRDVKLPEALLALPEAERVPLGTRYVARDVLDIEGAGPGAIGYYQRENKRWRVLSVHYADPDAAKDAALTLRKSAGWMPHKQTPYDSFKLTFPVADTGLSVEWVITLQLNRVWGVGDESEALDPALSDQMLSQRRLSYLEKLELLGKLLRDQR
ncbi:MAG TPA: DUF6599 family protein, partial [Polyangiaceae bacterium]|nr:DUF6599 family protein [Polyangiaceae bacterium]